MGCKKPGQITMQAPAIIHVKLYAPDDCQDCNMPLKHGQFAQPYEDDEGFTRYVHDSCKNPMEAGD